MPPSITQVGRNSNTMSASCPRSEAEVVRCYGADVSGRPSKRRIKGRSRGQHFIPRMHLRGFTAPFGPDQLARFDKTTGLIDYPSVSRAAKINDYYTMPAETGHLPDALEDTLAMGERIVAPWIRHLRAVDQPGRIGLDAVARDGLAGYFAMLHEPTAGTLDWLLRSRRRELRFAARVSLRLAPRPGRRLAMTLPARARDGRPGRSPRPPSRPRSGRCS